MPLRCMRVIFLALLLVLPVCQPRSYSYRDKRVSDQQFQAMEAAFRTSGTKGVHFGVPVGLNVDPIDVGRRKRTSELLKALLRQEQEEEDNPFWVTDNEQ